MYREGESPDKYQHYSMGRTACLVAQLVKNPPAMQERPWFNYWVGKIPGEGIGYPLQYSWSSPVAQMVKKTPAMQETPIPFLGRNYPRRRDRLPTPVFLGFHYGSTGKESACNVGDLDLIPGLGRSPGRDSNHFSILAWKIPWGRKESDTTEPLSTPQHGVQII